MGYNYTNSSLDDEDRREFLKAIGVAGAATAGGTALQDLTLRDLRDEVSVESADKLAVMGHALRDDLTEELDVALLRTEMAALADELQRMPDLYDRGIPETRDTTYQELTEPAWRITNHLAGAGFFASAEANLPAFTPEHIATTTKELIQTESLSGMLSDVGFSEQEQTEIVIEAVNNNGHLAQWVPAHLYQESEFGDRDDTLYASDIDPLHKRAAEGVLLWIDGLDRYLWQNKVLLTDEMVKQGIQDVKAMLGGFYLMAGVSHEVAQEAISDEQLTSLVTGSTAIMIVSQVCLVNDIARISDEKRAPRKGV